MILFQFQSIGRDLFTRGLVSSHSGNLSIRIGERVFITRRGSQLGNIGECDLIETGLNRNDRSTPLASIELPVHRAIYHETPALAVVHAHPPHAVALSLIETGIVPSDIDGRSISSCIPVLGWDTEVKPGEMGDVIARALREHSIVMVRGHGSFAVGQLLDDAYKKTTTLEESCRITCLLRALKIGQPQA